MTPQRNEDYVLRQVRAAAAMLARVIGLRLENRIDEAFRELDGAFGALLEHRRDLVRRLDSATAAALLRSPESIALYARLVREEALLRGEAPVRAAELAIEALRRDPDQDDAAALLNELRATMEAEQLPAPYREAFRNPRV